MEEKGHRGKVWVEERCGSYMVCKAGAMDVILENDGTARKSTTRQGLGESVRETRDLRQIMEKEIVSRIPA